MGQTVQEFDIHVKVGDTVRIIDGAFTDYTGKITEIDNNKVKMVISMFGNDTIAEVNLNQIAELQQKQKADHYLLFLYSSCVFL